MKVASQKSCAQSQSRRKVEELEDSAVQCDSILVASLQQGACLIKALGLGVAVIAHMICRVR